jgi:hypothetical protein
MNPEANQPIALLGSGGRMIPASIHMDAFSEDQDLPRPRGAFL